MSEPAQEPPAEAAAEPEAPAAAEEEVTAVDTEPPAAVEPEAAVDDSPGTSEVWVPHEELVPRPWLWELFVRMDRNGEPAL